MRAEINTLKEMLEENEITAININTKHDIHRQLKLLEKKVCFYFQPDIINVLGLNFIIIAGTVKNLFSLPFYN